MIPREIKHAIQSSFDRGADEYDAVTADPFTMLQRIFKPACTVTNSRVLDIGCGTGLSTLAFHQLQTANCIIGLDFSYNMVAVAQSKTQAHGIPAVHWLQGDTEQLPFAAEAFDVIISVAAFHWFSDKVQALDEMYRVLRTGGMIVLAFIGWKPGHYITAAYEQVMGQPLVVPLEEIWHPEQLVAIFKASKFRYYNVADFPLPNQFPLDEEDRRFLRVIVGWWREGLDHTTIEAIEKRFDEVIAGQIKRGENPLESRAIVAYLYKDPASFASVQAFEQETS